MKTMIVAVFLLMYMLVSVSAYGMPLYHTEHVDKGYIDKETSECVCYSEKVFLESVVKKYQEQLVFEGERKVFDNHVNTVRLYMNKTTKTWSLVQYFERDKEKTICIIEVGVNGKEYE